MALTRSLVKMKVTNTSMNQSEAVKMEEQQTRTILVKKPRASKGKQKTAIGIQVPTNNSIKITEPAMKRKSEENTCSAQDKKVKVEVSVTPTQIGGPAFAGQVIKIESASTSQTIKVEPSSASQTIKVESTTVKIKKELISVVPKVKKEPRVKVPKVKKEPKPKAFKVKREPKPKVVKGKPAFKLPPEANIYLNDAMRGRVTRAMKQRMFIMSRELSSENESVEKFEVLGSVGNSYTVSIAPTMKCTCMDYAIRRTHCKHILMVLLKVYRLPFNSPMFRSLNTSSEQRIEARTFARVVDPSVLVPKAIREKILSISHRIHPEAAPVVENNTQRRPLDTSDCPVCFEEFEEQKLDQIDFCKTCGNNVHKECFQLWARSKGADVSCVYCRSKWIADRPTSVASPSKKTVRQLDPAHINEGYYANYAAELGIARKRDTSTYRTNGNYPLHNAEYDD